MDPNQSRASDQRIAGHLWRFADCEFDELRRELRVRGAAVEMEAKPLEVLHQLLLHAGEVVTKDELLESVWPGLTVVDGSLATAISKLRKAFDGGDGIVVTLPRVGYRLAVPVQRKTVAPLALPRLRFEPGETIPGREHWRLVRRLDLSPSSETWLAEHHKTREARVFKFAPDVQHANGLMREVTVARLLRELLGERPEFVRILEWNFESDPYFIESEYCGPNLGQWAEMQGGLAQIPLDARLQLLQQVARAVAAAHDIDVLHKDLKPGNILVTSGLEGAWQIKIADFGSASLVEPSRLDALGITNLGFTQTGESQSQIGTLMYVAPEVLAGHSPTASADVYALGVLLYQLVVGDFRKPLSPGWEADIDDPLVREDIAHAACGDPARRLSSAAELAERLASLERRRIECGQRELTRQHTEIAERRVSDGRVRRAWVLVAIVAMLGGVALGLSFYRRAASPLPGAPEGRVQAARITSLAVLPLANMSGDPAQDYLAEGMTEALIAELSKIRALKVISRTSMMQYKATKKPLPEIARELNVNGIVEGSVLRSGDRVRTTAQLIYAATDAHLWAESYDRDLGDILNLQRELARQVSREIKIAVEPAEDRQLTRSGRVNPKAHELYLRGRFFWNRRTRDDLFKAADYFRAATEVDPDDPQAYAGLADAYVELVGFGNVLAAKGIPEAKAAALKAIDLNDSLAEPHVALAYVYGVDWDWANARREFQRALELNPGDAVALYQYGFFLSLVGKPDEAFPPLEQVLDLDPLSPIVLYRAGRAYYHARHYAKAAELFGRILELNPNDPLGLYGLGLVSEAQGKFDEAVRYLERQTLQGGFDVAAVYAAAGDKARARRRLAEELRRHREQKSYIRPGWVAEVYVSLGDKDEAFRWLERAYRERDAWLALLKVWPRFDALRSDPRFEDLVRRMNFPP
ncbi:MAG TPA: tetratricopeptide repeat protein [Vicinamibacterales bacterium]|nr:tetratricopeptide repeat protein [Vicinamibacterales bacterium]